MQFCKIFQQTGVWWTALCIDIPRASPGGYKFLEYKLYKCPLHKKCPVNYFFSDNIWDKLKKKRSKRLGDSFVTSKLEGISNKF